MGHLAFGVQAGKIDLEDLVSPAVISDIQRIEEKFDSLKGFIEHFGGKYDYGTLRLVLYSHREDGLD